MTEEERKEKIHLAEEKWKVISLEWLQLKREMRDLFYEETLRGNARSALACNRVAEVMDLFQGAWTDADLELSCAE